MAVSLPVVLLILDWYPLQRISSVKTFRASLIEKLPFFVLSIGSSIITILAQKAGDAIKSVELIPLSTRLLVAAKSLITYLWKMIVPIHLVPYYPYPRDASLLSAEYLAAIVLGAAITAVCLVMLRRQQRLWLSVWAYFVVTLIPVLGIVQVGDQAMADRYTYLPGIGPFLIISLIITWCTEKMLNQIPAIKYFCSAALILLLLCIPFLTWKQTSIWKNSFTLWTYVIEKEPRKAPVAYNNRGFAYTGKGQFKNALEDFNTAIALNPSYYEAYYNRGIVFEKLGLPNRAKGDYDAAIVLNPASSPAYNNRGILNAKAGLFEKAIEDFTEAITVNPRHSRAYSNRGSTFTEMGQYDRALEDFNKAIELAQDFAGAYMARGDLYGKTGEEERAVADFQAACDLGDREGCSALQNLRIPGTNWRDSEGPRVLK
jgi:tetratricopeptide (TPR) repeat protein